MCSSGVYVDNLHPPVSVSIYRQRGPCTLFEMDSLKSKMTGWSLILSTACYIISIHYILSYASSDELSSDMKFIPSSVALDAFPSVVYWIPSVRLQ